MKNFFLFIFLIFLLFTPVNLGAQFQGIVLDSIGNPVYKANVCKFRGDVASIHSCQLTDRWGKYNLQLSPNEIIRVQIKYDSIPEILKFYKYQEDPFDGVGYLTEIEWVKNTTEWYSEKLDSIGNSLHYPIKKNKIENNYRYTYFSKILIEQDSANLLYDSDYVKGRLGFDLDLSYSISEHLKTPALQNRFVQGRPNNGTLEHFGPPEPYSWEPAIENTSGLSPYNPNEIFQKGNEFKVEFNAAYERKSNFFHVNFFSSQKEGLLKPIENQQNYIRANYNFPAWGGYFKSTIGAH